MSHSATHRVYSLPETINAMCVILSSVTLLALLLFIDTATAGAAGLMWLLIVMVLVNTVVDQFLKLRGVYQYGLLVFNTVMTMKILLLF